MRRRAFIRSISAGSCLSGFALLSGCGDDMKESGGVVKAPAEDLKSMEASAEAYKAEAREKKGQSK